jgi:hypothetical protein
MVSMENRRPSLGNGWLLLILSCQLHDPDLLLNLVTTRSLGTIGFSYFNLTSLRAFNRHHSSYTERQQSAVATW